MPIVSLAIHVFMLFARNRATQTALQSERIVPHSDCKQKDRKIQLRMAMRILLKQQCCFGDVDRFASVCELGLPQYLPLRFQQS